MLKVISILFVCFIGTNLLAQSHPFTFITKEEGLLISSSISKYPLLKSSFGELKKEVDSYLNSEVDVPIPKDPAGGYSHDKHKSNYMLMFNSGLLFNITGDKQYAALVKNLLLKYAKLNPTLKQHPQATSDSPGLLFWQSLNDANWMVYSGLAFDLIYNYLTPAERTIISEGAFKPEVQYITVNLKNWYNRLHNHSVWAAAGVGIIGLATNNQDYIDKALYGTDKKGKSGFIAQLDNLFSPDGYYTEGPYYVRYAILPYMLFANAIENKYPEMHIFQHRDSILKKAINTCLQQTNLDGSFFPINDALKEKDFTSNELVTSIDIARNRYGLDLGLLSVAKKQNRVSLDKGGVLVAAGIKNNTHIPEYFPYRTIESTDGVNGNEGGVSVLRSGKEQNLTSVVFKYASQGLGHGHFDRLGLCVFDKGKEVLQDYGASRFIGIEQKYGGRYLLENAKYAAQTVAHNTVVVDEMSHFNGNTELGEKYFSKKLFSSVLDSKVQVVSASDENAYKGVSLKRTVFLVTPDSSREFIIDLFSANADSIHQFDLPFHYNGNLISTNYHYTYSNKLEPLGVQNGYQYLWNEAEASIRDSMSQLTYLNNNRFYTLSSKVSNPSKIYFAKIGANDPNYNLRREPAYIIRTNTKNPLFVNVLEMHGNYDTRNEFSVDAYSMISNINIISNDEMFTIVEIFFKKKNWLIALSNKDIALDKHHEININSKTIKWTGPYLFKETF